MNEPAWRVKILGSRKTISQEDTKKGVRCSISRSAGADKLDQRAKTRPLVHNRVPTFQIERGRRDKERTACPKSSSF